VKAARRILLLDAGGAAATDLRTLAESLAAQGATVVVRGWEHGYDALLDDIAAAETVVCWS